MTVKKKLYIIIQYQFLKSPIVLSKFLIIIYHQKNYVKVVNVS